MVYKTCFPDTFGGIEQALLELCRGLVDRGDQVTVLTLSRQVRTRDELVYEGVTIVRLPIDWEIASSPFSIRAFREFRRLQRQADLIHLHYPWPFGDILYLLGGASKPAVVTYHSDIVKQKWLQYVYAPLRKLSFAKVRIVAATSPNYVRSSLTLRPYRDKTVSIPLGLDESRYPQPRMDKVREYEERWGARYFAFVGVFRYYKGLSYLIEAAVGVRATIVLMGDGPERLKIEALANELGAANVVFLGAVDAQTKVDVLAGCGGFVFPSCYRSEAFGLGLVEAAMRGKPMLSCEIGTGTSYVNLNGVTGLTVEPRDPRALKWGMEELLSDPRRSDRYGLAARQRYQDLLSASRFVESYRTVYRQLLESV